jgi:hypothetical protein
MRIRLRDPKSLFALGSLLPLLSAMGSICLATVGTVALRGTQDLHPKGAAHDEPNYACGHAGLDIGWLVVTRRHRPRSIRSSRNGSIRPRITRSSGWLEWPSNKAETLVFMSPSSRCGHGTERWSMTSLSTHWSTSQPATTRRSHARPVGKSLRPVTRNSSKRCSLRWRSESRGANPAQVEGSIRREGRARASLRLAN